MRLQVRAAPTDQMPPPIGPVCRPYAFTASGMAVVSMALGLTGTGVPPWWVG